MLIQIASDLHLEFGIDPNIIKPCGDVLCLCGDICCMVDDSTINYMVEFLTQYTKHYKYILWVPGNHEYYTSRVNELDKASTYTYAIKNMNQLTKQFPNLIILNNKSVDIKLEKTYRFIGSTLWTHIPADRSTDIEQAMSDYKKIRIWRKRVCAEYISTRDVNRWHNNCVKFLKSEIAQLKYTDAKAIILTHHKPYLSEHKSDISDAYEVDMNDLMTPRISMWAYGHTHVPDKTRINSVFVISNPGGYPDQKIFNPASVVKL